MVQGNFAIIVLYDSDLAYDHVGHVICLWATNEHSIRILRIKTNDTPVFRGVLFSLQKQLYQFLVNPQSV